MKQSAPERRPLARGIARTGGDLPPRFGPGRRAGLDASAVVSVASVGTL